MVRVACAVVLVALLAPAADALGLPPFTTVPRTAPGQGGQAQLTSLATGCHGRFDRVVVRARLATPGYDARYVRRVIADPSGRVVRLLGTRRIRVVLREARGPLPAVRTPLCPDLRQVELAGDFEGVVSLGLGLRRQTGFRVLRLTRPTRVVVDVAH